MDIVGSISHGLIRGRWDRLMRRKYNTGGAVENKSKVKKVMGEFNRGVLKSSSGDKVTDSKQAMAIALSEARRT
jgi:hypothetical protein